MFVRVFFVLYCIFISSAGNAQFNFKNGYVVTVKGDTLPGDIDYKEWTKNPKEITFKPFTDPQSIKKFTCNDIRFFSAYGYDAYTSASVYISMDEVQLARLKDYADTIRVLDTIFLQVLTQGASVNLYSYQDEIKNRFYIQEDQTKSPSELVFKQYKRNSQVITSELYKQQLIFLAKKYHTFTPDLEKIIQRSSYTQADLLTVVNHINGSKPKEKTQHASSKPKSRFFVSTGLNIHKFTYRGENHLTYDRLNSSGYPLYKSSVSSVSLTPRFSAGLDWFTNPSIQRLIFRGEIGASILSSKTSTVEKYRYPDEDVAYQYTLTALNLSVAPQVIYTIYSKENFKVYAGTGMSLNWLHFQKNAMDRKPYNPTSGYHEVTFNNYLKLKSSYLNVIVRSGVILTKKIDLSMIWYSPVNFTNYSDGTAVLMEANSLHLSVGYLFNKPDR